MQLIKKIISWLISLFHMVFKRDNKKLKKSSTRDSKVKLEKNKTKAITGVIDETMPSYMFISVSEKNLLINRIKELKKEMQKRENEHLEKEISLLINLLEECTNKDNKELKEIVNTFKNDLLKPNKNTNKQFDLLVNYVSGDKKDDIILKYNNICKEKKEISKNIVKVDNIISSLEKRNITIIEKNHIEDANDDYENSKNTLTLEEIETYNKDVLYVMENINKNIIDKVKLDYKKINYITMTTELLDEIQVNLKKIEDNYNNHRYNKRYYDREINKIKRQILELKELKNKPYVYNEILKLRKELYTKSKDKYDILYNNEIFIDINQKCDDLVNKVNAKVVDIKKEEKKEKKDKKNDYLKNIILRFQDMELARQIIIDSEINDFKDDKEMILYIKNMYNKFSSEINAPFNFERNKEKTELVVLFNELNKVNCYLKKDKYIPIEHINFRMNDLLEAVNYKKEELSTVMKRKYNVDITDELVDNKINYLMENEHMDKPKTLVKKDDKLS